MHKKPARALFVFASDPRYVGGHFISAITLAKKVQSPSIQIGFLIAPLDTSIPEFENSNIKFHYQHTSAGKIGFLKRALSIYQVVKAEGYTHVVAMDQYSALQSIFAVVFQRTPLIQIRPGGNSPAPSVSLPGILLFSEELSQLLKSRHKIPSEYIKVSSGQVDFEHFGKATDAPDDVLPFINARVRILSVSRLFDIKVPAMMALFSQLELASKEHALSCLIIGDGPSRSDVEGAALQTVKRTNGRVDIKMLGTLRVKPQHIKQADMVVGQGRTVMEGIACNIPTAVCGNDGYFGLVTLDNLEQLAVTNLTGRGLKPFSDLASDIRMLAQHREQELQKIFPIAFRKYDVSGGADILREYMNGSLSNEFSSMSRLALLMSFSLAWYKTILLSINSRHREKPG